MAKEKIGEVQKPSMSGQAYLSTNYPVYWDSATGAVYVTNDRAGTASSREAAMVEANYYVTTNTKRS